MLFFVRGEHALPAPLGALAALFRIPTLIDALRNLEGRVFPAESGARCGHLRRSERRAVRGARARLGRRAFGDHRLGANEGRPRALALGLPDRAVHRLDVVAVDSRNDLPTVWLAAPAHVVRV